MIVMGAGIRIIPLGGFDKIGMNMTLVESSEAIVAVDCGISFPPNNMPGIATSVPDINYLRQNIDRFKGIVLTHGHQDHIGAIPYIAQELPVPIYGTPLTIGLVEESLKDFGIKGIKTRAIKPGSTMVIGDFKVEFIRTNHSIPDSAMLAFHTSEGLIIHTGDFKFDMSPIIGEPADMARLAALGAKGVLAVLSDSTNAMLRDTSKSERDVFKQLDWFFNFYGDRRIIISTFASNMERIQQILDLGRKYGRKVAMEGEVMLRVFSIARKLGYMDVPEDIIIEAGEIDSYKDEEIVFLTTGNHGEAVKSIASIASGDNPEIRIRKNDVVLFSSVAIQGDEVEFSKTLNSLEEQGAIVEFQDIHATGHACAEEIKLLYSLLRPRFVIPAHGEYRLRREAKRIAASIGIESSNILLARNGDVIELTDDSCRIVDRIPLREILIDGYEKSCIATSVLEERSQLSQSGVVIVEICLNKETGRYASGVKITSRGFVDMSVKPEIEVHLKEVISTEMSRLISQGVRDERAEKNIIKAAGDFLRDETGKDPIVVAMVTEVMI